MTEFTAPTAGRDPADNLSLPLTGLKVVSLEQAAAAPLCTRRLVLAGADVYKIERPEGDFARHYDAKIAGHSSYFVWLNAGKKSVVLDLKQAQDRGQLKLLIQTSDVFVQNLKPGALHDLGLALDDLHQLNPRLISVSISGFHESGPGAQRKAYDLLMQAESGLADITGSPHAPGRVGVSMVDMSTGMFAYEAVLEALLMRRQTGRGERLSVALFDAVAEWMSVPYLLQQFTGEAPPRVGLAHPGICPYGVFHSRENKPFILSIQNEREWVRLCHEVLRQPDLLEDPRCMNNETRVANRTFVDGTLQQAFAHMPYARVENNLHRADLAFAPVNSVQDLAAHPDFRQQSVIVHGESVSLPVVPGRARPSGLKVPELGEHTKEVLSRLENLAPPEK